MSTEDFPKLSLDEILNGRKAAQRSMAVCLRLDLLADIEEREREIVRLTNDADDDDPRMGAPGRSAQLADEIRALEAEAEQYTIDLRLQALDREVWPQKVDEFTETGEDGTSKMDMAALTVDIFPQSLVSPPMGAEQQQKFLKGLSEGQWGELMQLVFDLNRKTVTVGKSLTASMVTKPKSAKQGPDGR